MGSQCEINVRMLSLNKSGFRRLQSHTLLLTAIFLLLDRIAFAGFHSDKTPEQIQFLTVEIFAEGGESGTGVIIKSREDGNGLVVLTAGHILEGAIGISIRFSTGETRKTKLLYLNSEMDFALLGVDEISLPVRITYPDHRMIVGSDIFVIGYSGLFQYSASHGIVSSYGGHALNTDAQASFGASGSGVWDEFGRLVGIVTHVYVEEVESGDKRYFMQRQTIALDILRILEDMKLHHLGFLD
jgi:S1-C subfamily serine protease